MSAPGSSELTSAYSGARVVVTGHTGFKGGWLVQWLAQLGAEVTGYALAPDTTPSLFEAAAVERGCATSVLGDVRDLDRLRAAVRAARPHVVFHLAAQPLVRRSYEEPLATVQVNVLGTAHLLEALRVERLRCAVVVVTSDKCYENRDAAAAYDERQPMGGHDVYSMSKGATELLVASWRRSFFPPALLAEHGVAVATARSGNVVGGGDWARDRIVPDAVAALAAGRPVPVRNPDAVRPWQHVLEPLGGYLLLGARLRGIGTREPATFCEPWNFGPRPDDARPVRELVAEIVQAWGSGSWEERREPAAPHEAPVLRLAIDKARDRLGWEPRWRLNEAVRRTVEWYRAFQDGARGDGLRELCRRDVAGYMAAGEVR